MVRTRVILPRRRVSPLGHIVLRYVKHWCLRTPRSRSSCRCSCRCRCLCNRLPDVEQEVVKHPDLVRRDDSMLCVERVSKKKKKKMYCCDFLVLVLYSYSATLTTSLQNVGRYVALHYNYSRYRYLAIYNAYTPPILLLSAILGNRLICSRRRTTSDNCSPPTTPWW